MNIYELITLFEINFDDTFDDIKKKYKNLIFKYHPDHSGKNTSDQFIYIKDSFNIIKKLFLNLEKNTTFKKALLINIKNKEINNDILNYFFNTGSIDINSKLDKFSKINLNKKNMKNLKTYLFRNLYFSNKKFYRFIITFSSLFYFLSMYQNRFKYYSRISERAYEKKYLNFEKKFYKNVNHYLNDRVYIQFKIEMETIISLCKNIIHFYKKRMEKFTYSNPGLRKILIDYAKIEDQIYELLIEIFFTQIRFYDNNIYDNNDKNILEKNKIIAAMDESFIYILEFEKKYTSNVSNKNFHKTYNKIINSIKIMKNILTHLKNIKENYIPFPLAVEETKIWFENNL